MTRRNFFARQCVIQKTGDCRQAPVFLCCRGRQRTLTRAKNSFLISPCLHIWSDGLCRPHRITATGFSFCVMLYTHSL
ncbi:hypothetical protein CKO_02998 [Citrobacter koseri ATCC BAA-895]|uniref:Uncharacterized protein n=1 Tax=Citrobacter koseri (strain ATCC BAA-895 / CDC 4225-83 / SGSC4696) TaxID=290338 RepID=A8AKT5_CITK8|nr:hypothetical protein CKO_02998 [Citrobacter koseri ATCC BAA-895]